MSSWSGSVQQLRSSGQAAVMVSVDSIVGSTPRETGARMIVTGDSQIGTIGGGNLEYQACRIARNQLESGADDQLKKFPLGAGLGQCCGGLVNLMFERLDADSDWDAIEAETQMFELYLFGAGHVGTAVVQALKDLPLRIHWIDTRDDCFPEIVDSNVEIVCTDIPEAEIDAAAVGSWFLVMTHDHGLDQRLCEQILKRDDFAYFGLIGSKSKRRNFETRMKKRGIPEERFENMTCPIGIPGIEGKQPAQIAISVAAELLQHYEKLQHQQNNNESSLYRVEGRI